MLKFDQCELLAVVDVARDLRVDFLKLAPSRDFETSSRAVKKLQGATLSLSFIAKDGIFYKICGNSSRQFASSGKAFLQRLSFASIHNIIYY